MARLRRAARRAARKQDPEAQPEAREEAQPEFADLPPEPEPEAHPLIAEPMEDEPRAAVPFSARALVEKTTTPEHRSAQDLAADEFDLDSEAEFIPTPVLIRMQAFVGHYLASLNAAEAARQAGYSEHGADRAGRRLLAHPEVRRMMKEQHRALLAKLSVTQERVWAEIAGIAFLDPLDLFTETGELRSMAEVPENIRRAISGFKITHKVFGDDGEVTEKEIKFVSKDAALEKLARLTGLFKEEKVTATDIATAIVDGLARARQRVITAGGQNGG
ncbi:MAG: terminase small subunit [Elusimicrobiales bacterium]